MWKKICAVVATILAAIVAAILCRGMPKRGRVHGTDSDIRQALRDAGQAGDANTDARNTAIELADVNRDAQRTAGEIAELNRDAKADIERGREILRRARERARQESRPDGTD